MKTKKSLLLIALLALCTLPGCSKRMPVYTPAGKQVLLVQKQVSLYRKKPPVWPAKGKVIATADELIFIPSPYLGGLHINGRDSTFIDLGGIVRLQEKRWMLVFPFGLQVTTADSLVYSFVTVRRNELVRKISASEQKE